MSAASSATSNNVSSHNGSFRERLLRSLRLSSAFWPESANSDPLMDDFSLEEQSPLKTLLVVAHPDDESECAALLYRITHEAGGIVDQVILTDGAAGHQYAAPAQTYYGLSAYE